MKIQRRVRRNEKRESTGQFLAVSKVRSADHIRENEIRKEHASQPELRKLPERRYIDNHWVDYDKFLHPEKEEQEKLEDMAKEIKAAAEPLRRFLEKYYDPTVEVVVDTGVVTVKRGEYMTIFQKEEVPEENE